MTLDGAIFSQGYYKFLNLKFDKYHYTDNRKGVLCHYLAYMKRGRSEIKSAQRRIEIKEGDLFYIPKGLCYQSYWYGEPEIDFISLGFVHFPDYDEKKYILQVIEGPDELKKAVLDVPLEEPMANALGRFYTALSAVLPYMEYEEGDLNSRVIRAAEQYLTENPHAKAQDIARHCCISISSLYQIFRKSADTTPNGMRQRLLCEKAVLLLTTTDKPIEAISYELGFSSPSYFRKILRKHTGKSPSEIRHLSVLQ